MKKTLYSLMLSEEVIREIDRLAHRLGTNRSSLVNQILAEHVQLQTPEKRVSDIFAAIEELMASSRELVPLPMLTQGSPSMALRSCLEYKYRPTVRYEVELLPAVKDGSFGRLSVIFRTTSAALLGKLTEFFGLLRAIENDALNYPRGYSLEVGRFDRTLTYPIADDKHELTSNQLAEAISDYIRLLDRLLKGYVAGNLDADETARTYYRELKFMKTLI